MADALFDALYSELHLVANRELARQGVPLSLGATTLLHQAYIEIAGGEGTSFPDRARFIAYASRVMRGLIIDHARSRKCGSERQLRTGDWSSPNTHGSFRDFTGTNQIRG